LQQAVKIMANASTIAVIEILFFIINSPSVFIFISLVNYISFT